MKALLVRLATPGDEASLYDVASVLRRWSEFRRREHHLVAGSYTIIATTGVPVARIALLIPEGGSIHDLYIQLLRYGLYSSDFRSDLPAVDPSSLEELRLLVHNTPGAAITEAMLELLASGVPPEWALAHVESQL